MGDDLHIHYSSGIFGWLFGLMIAVCVVVWLFWIAVVGVLAVVLLVVLGCLVEYVRGRIRRGRPARAKRRRLRDKPYRIYR